MKPLLLLFVIGAITLSSPVTVVASPATLGGGFADAYSAFGPIYALYRSYADYLFAGTPVVIPAGLDGACQTFSHRLASLQVALVTEKGGNTDTALTYLVRARQATESFCASHRTTLWTIAAMSTPDMTFLATAAKAGFFASISDINNLMGRAFDHTLTAFPDAAARWRFSVAFATRTLIDKQKITRIDPALSKILLGSADTPPPPSGLAPVLMTAVKELAAYSGKTLTAEAAARVNALAATIYHALVANGK